MRWVLCLGFLVAACEKQGNSDGPGPTLIDPVAPGQPGPARPKVALMTPAGELAVTVEVVVSPALLARGLMYREHLPPDAGMLFLMNYEADHEFYMRNTLIPLDMIFITKDFTVAGIVENATPRTEEHRHCGKPSFYVLEVNGGWSAAHQVTAGTKVRFDGVTGKDQ